MRTGLGAAVIALIATAGCGAAQALTYNVNRDFGLGGGIGVVGTIDTDGTFGVLTTANITGWSLLLTDFGGTQPLAGPESATQHEQIAGSAVTATPTAILFNFAAAAGSYLLFQSPVLFGAADFWCVHVSPGCSSALPTGEVSWTGSGGSYSSYATAARSGNVVIASREVGAVPLPAALPLLAAALAGLGVTGWRRRRPGNTQ